MLRSSHGFTLIELIVTLVLLALLAVVALPRLDTGANYSADFHDRTLAALRYAQKTATSHRREVCVTFPNAATLALEIAGTPGGTCNTALPLPGSNTNTVVSGDAAQAFFDPLPSAWRFASDGTGIDQSIVINGAGTIRVVGSTGYVH